MVHTAFSFSLRDLSAADSGVLWSSTDGATTPDDYKRLKALEALCLILGRCILAFLSGRGYSSTLSLKTILRTLSCKDI